MWVVATLLWRSCSIICVMKGAGEILGLEGENYPVQISYIITPGRQNTLSGSYVESLAPMTALIKSFYFFPLIQYPSMCPWLKLQTSAFFSLSVEEKWRRTLRLYSLSDSRRDVRLVPGSLTDMFWSCPRLLKYCRSILALINVGLNLLLVCIMTTFVFCRDTTGE